MAAARGTAKRQLGYTLRRRVAALDPAEDHEEVARLTLEVHPPISKRSLVAEASQDA